MRATNCHKNISDKNSSIVKKSYISKISVVAVYLFGNEDEIKRFSFLAPMTHCEEFEKRNVYCFVYFKYVRSYFLNL